MTTAAPPPRLLLVLAHGIGARELAPVRAGSVWSGTMPTAALRLPDEPAAAVRDDLGAARELDDLGITVDRSSLVLRPAGRSDATAVAGVARRATGPADVTLFEARDVLLQAVVGGPVAAVAAARQLGAMLDRLGDALRRGDPPEVWFVGLGSTVAVQTTFDLATAWRECLLAPLAGELALQLAPGSATVRGDNQRALDLAAAALRRPPFARHGRVQAVGNGRLQFTAAPGVAFGPRPLAGRAALPHEADGIACAPLGDLVHTADLGLAQLLARFWMRAAALHVDEVAAVAPDPAAVRDRADLPNLGTAPAAADPPHVPTPR